MSLYYSLLQAQGYRFFERHVFDINDMRSVESTYRVCNSLYALEEWPAAAFTH